MINSALTFVYFIVILVTDNNSPLSKICLLDHGGDSLKSKDVDALQKLRK